MNPETLIQLTNEYRVKNGLKPLKLDASLKKASDYRGNDMASTQSFSHDVATTTQMKKAWDFMKNAQYDYDFAGENLAINYNTPEEVVSAWIASPSHNKNLLSDKYTDISISVVPGMYQGKQTNYIVQLFGSKKAKATPKPEQAKSVKPAQKAQVQYSLPRSNMTRQDIDFSKLRMIQK